MGERGGKRGTPPHEVHSLLIDARTPKPKIRLLLSHLWIGGDCAWAKFEESSPAPHLLRRGFVDKPKSRSPGRKRLGCHILKDERSRAEKGKKDRDILKTICRIFARM